MEKEAGKDEHGLLGDEGLKSFPTSSQPQNKNTHVNFRIHVANDAGSKNNDPCACKHPFVWSVYFVWLAWSPEDLSHHPHSRLGCGCWD